MNMNTNKIAIIVGIILVIIIGVWGFLNLSPFLGSLFNRPTGSVTINDQTIRVEVADTPEKQETGLSQKKSLPDDQGMLFVFEEPGYPSFWMKEMQFPIDIIFINDTTVTTLYANVQPPESNTAPLAVFKPTSPSDKVLEVNAGKAAELGIEVGSTLQIELE